MIFYAFLVCLLCSILKCWPPLVHPQWRPAVLLYYFRGPRLRPLLARMKAYLCPVGYEDGRSEVADHARPEVDDGDAAGAGQLLQVTHQPVLQDHRHHQVDQAENIFKVFWNEEYGKLM